MDAELKHWAASMLLTMVRGTYLLSMKTTPDPKQQMKAIKPISHRCSLVKLGPARHAKRRPTQTEKIATASHMGSAGNTMRSIVVTPAAQLSTRVGLTRATP